MHSSVIGDKLKRSKSWVTKWVVHGRVNDALIDKKSSAVTTKWLDDNLPSHIKPKDWPPNSPDLSAVENLWSILSLSVYKDPEPSNVVQLKRRVQRAWRSEIDRSGNTSVADPVHDG